MQVWAHQSLCQEAASSGRQATGSQAAAQLQQSALQSAAGRHSPLAITPSWLVAMQLTMACEEIERKREGRT